MTRAWQPARDAEGKPCRPTLAELAKHVGGHLRGGGDGSGRIAGLRSLDDAGAEDLSFVHGAAYFDAAADSSAAAFVVSDELADGLEAALAAAPDAATDTARDTAPDDPSSSPPPLLVVESSQWAVARILGLLFVQPRPPAGVHETAVVADDVMLGEGVHVGPLAIVGEGSRLDDEAVIEGHAVVGRHCEVGAASWIHAGAVLYDGTILGRRVRVHSGAVVGGPGFGFTTVDGVHHGIPQVGRVEIGDDVEIGNLSAVDRATLGATRIGAGTKIDNLVQVGHNVVLGKGCILCGKAAIAGSSELGDYVVLAGAAGVSDHVHVGSRATLAACATALQDVAEGETIGGSFPTMEIGLWRRVSRSLLRLPELIRRLRRLEKRFDKALDGLRRSEPEP